MFFLRRNKLRAAPAAISWGIRLPSLAYHFETQEGETTILMCEPSLLLHRKTFFVALAFLTLLISMPFLLRVMAKE